MAAGPQYKLLQRRTMELSMPISSIKRLTGRQIDTLFMGSADDNSLIDHYIQQAIIRCEQCFSRTPNKYYQKNGTPYFNPYHSVQYMIYLYYLANSIYQEKGCCATCDKLYYLNKVLNGLDLFYAVQMPDFFMAEHPVGSVIGRATISNGFMFYQNCTVGGFHLPNKTIAYPTIGSNVKMFAGSSIIGNCHIGNEVNVGAGALIKNQDVPDCSNVFGQSPNLIIKPIKKRE